MNGAGTYNHGETATLTATPATGYHFVNWTKSGTPVCTTATYTFTVTNDSSFVANFAINTYTLTLTANGDGMVTTPIPADGVTSNGNGTYTVNYGTTVTVNATAAPLHHVAGWSDENQNDLSANATYSDYAVTNPNRFPAKSSINVTVTGDTTMMATFGINSYEVNAAVANGQGERGTVQIAFTNANNQAQTIATTATVTSIQAVALGGSTTTLTAIPETGYHFVNWTNGDVILGTDVVLTTTEALAAIANFAPNSYTITYMDGETELNVDTFDYQQPITEYTTSKNGWDFIGWSPAVPELMPAENLTVYAQWFLICNPVTDIDNNTYPTVNIGNICWMASNMRATHFADGREITNIYEYATPLHPNADENVLLYGRLYDWYDALDVERPTKSLSVQGICPNGWVIPNEDDFEVLNQVNLHTLLSSSYWVFNNGDNSTGFDLKPSGMYNIDLSRYEELLSGAYLWSATATSATEAHCHKATCYCNDSLLDLIRNKENAFSVRCVKHGE